MLQQEMGDRNVPPPLIPVPAKPDPLAFLSVLCESQFFILSILFIHVQFPIQN